MSKIDPSAISRPGGFHEALAQPIKTVTLPQIPNSVEELAQQLQALGHDVVLQKFSHAGERSSGWLARVSFDGVDCILKFSGPATDVMYPCYSAGVQTEREGLALMTGYAPRLLAEVKVDGEIIAVFREFIERGISIVTALQESRLSKEEALEKAQGIALKLAQSGLKLWDVCPDNIWILEDGSAILIEGQCATPSTDGYEALKTQNLRLIDAMLS